MTDANEAIDELSYEGCARACWPRNKERHHTLVWGECAYAKPPPCRHPGERLSWVVLKNVLECAACGQTVGLVDLLDQAQATVLGGCTCADEGESGHDPQCFKPIGWSLDPDQVRALIDALPPYVLHNTLLGVFVYGERKPPRGESR